MAKITKVTKNPTNPADSVREAVAKLLVCLPVREREIVTLRYGLKDGYSYTLNEVASIFGISRERVRYLESRALFRLQRAG